MIRGPGVARNQSTDQFALNIDLAPTIVDMATGHIPAQFDGRSMYPLFVPCSLYLCVCVQACLWCRI